MLATFDHALPRTYAGVDASNGTVVRVTVSGASGGIWLVVRTVGEWTLYADEVTEPSAHVAIDEIDAWKLLTKRVDPEAVKKRVTADGDQTLASKILETVSIIA